MDGTGTSPNILAVGQGPRANGFSPNPVPWETMVTITGTNLQGVTQVHLRWRRVRRSSDRADGDIADRCTVPAGALTGPVSLTDRGNTVTSTAIFKIAPKITDFTPGTAVGGSGDLVTVNGTNLRARDGESDGEGGEDDGAGEPDPVEHARPS